MAETLRDLEDVRKLVVLTEERASAARHAADSFDKILQYIAELNDAVMELVACSRKVEGMVNAIAIYLASREGADRDRIEQLLVNAARDGGKVVVQQHSGTSVEGDLRAESGRDVNVAGGNIDGG